MMPGIIFKLCSLALMQDQFQSEALEKKIFQDSNFWNGNANASRQGSLKKKNKKQIGENNDSSTRKKKLTKQQTKTFNKQKDKFRLNNPFQKRRSNLQSMMYQGMFTIPTAMTVDNETSSNTLESQPEIIMEEQRVSGIGNSSNTEESIAIRLDRIEDILLYLACRLRNQEILENVKQEWRFLAEVIDRVLVIAFMLTTFFCTYMLISNAKTGGHEVAIKMAQELKENLNSTVNST